MTQVKELGLSQVLQAKKQTRIAKSNQPQEKAEKVRARDIGVFRQKCHPPTTFPANIILPLHSCLSSVPEDPQWPLQSLQRRHLRIKNTLEVSHVPTLRIHVAVLINADEINALVLDSGSYTTRAGFAGEDTPKSVVPTSYGLLPSGERVFGENSIHLPRPDMEIRNPYSSDGIIEDWETASKLWEYTITSRLTGAKPTAPSRNGLNDTKDENGDVVMDEQREDQEAEESPLAEYPLLMSEPPWNPTKAREKTMEVAMEEWGVPAFFLAKNGQLAA